ncbi:MULTISPECIES: serine protease [unclassified Pseudofrankia]|uniref:trypsin-like serine peptidase n=1 Tax=unclassified Pseudofrankia TaxID=2994372 RepID=UPI0012FF8462|nr:MULTISPECIES: trypsin-like peptidase domain-containing protein [unclassified Pseudofrankia]MDT3440292.1 trypsin-like peptidase domain-containing protein [Pseudofrankia sp. BMG5.37]
MGLVLQDEKVVSHHARIEELLRDSPVTSVPETIDAPIEDTDVISPDVLELVERQTGDRSTLIDISLLRGALRVSPAVVRLVVHFGRVPYTATGVCISRNTILTNHHVIYDWDNGERRLTSGVAWLGYETSSGGLVRDPIKLNLTPESAIGDRALDWCVISTHAPIPETFGYLRLPTDSELEVGDAVSIIQHPNGRPKQISLQHNAVVSIAGSTVSYFTDTEEGSSGSPVFDEQWRVVALHKGSGNERIGSARKIVNRGTLIGAVIRGLGNAQVPFETMR